jgi:hypothetical protein
MTFDPYVVAIIIILYLLGVVILTAFCVVVYVALHIARMVINKEIGLYRAHNAYRPPPARKIYHEDQAGRY